MTTRYLKWALPIGLGILVRLIPVPVGLTPAAWHYFALFVAVVAALVTEPLPAAAVGFIGVALAAALKMIGQTPAGAITWALSGYSNETVWLIFAANMFALGYEVTGLGRRIALLLVKKLGRRTLGLGYAIAFSDLVLAPFMPSATARSGGTIYPVVKNIPPLYGSTAELNPRKIGSYLMWTGFSIDMVTSSMFLTGMAPNLLGLELARKIAHIDITWLGWMLGFLPVGILLFAGVPLLTYVLYPPEIKRGNEVPEWAAKELSGLGPVTRRELTMALLAVAALGGWIIGGAWLAPVTVAIVVVSLMLLTNVIAWSDVAANKPAWSVLVWIASLLTLADGLNIVGFLPWFAHRATSSVANVSPTAIAVIVVTIFFVIHYFFASTTAHTVAVLPVFLAALLEVKGVPMRAVTLMLLYASGLMGVITPYAFGPGPIWYGSGYISTKDFWRLGAIFGFIFLAALLGLGLPYVLAFRL